VDDGYRHPWHPRPGQDVGGDLRQPLGGESGARDAGKLRSEGKEYVVQDGDVLLFRFNV